MFDTDGPVAEEIADLWWLLFVFGTAMFVVFAAALIVGLVRRRSDDEDAPGPQPRALKRWVVGGGLIMPSIVLVVVMIFTVASMRAMPSGAPDGALQVEVVGHRWWYEIRYPDHGVVTANELHLPVDRPVELTLSSADVIHSFWVPALGGKLDMLPDHTNTLVLEANEIGEHRTQCAEFCGLQHARMRLLTVVESGADFAAFVATQSADATEPPEGAAARGQEVFSSTGCASCHAVRGTGAAGTAGPDLTHLASRQSIAAVTRPRTEDALREWISNPDAIKKGALMPATTLDDEQMDDLIAYLESLR